MSNLLRLNDPYKLKEIKAGQYSVTSNEPINFSHLIKELEQLNIQINSLAYEKKDLEKIFLELVSEV